MEQDKGMEQGKGMEGEVVSNIISVPEGRFCHQNSQSRSLVKAL